MTARHVCIAMLMTMALAVSRADAQQPDPAAQFEAALRGFKGHDVQIVVSCGDLLVRKLTGFDSEKLVFADADGHVIELPRATVFAVLPLETAAGDVAEIRRSTSLNCVPPVPPPPPSLAPPGPVEVVDDRQRGALSDDIEVPAPPSRAPIDQAPRAPLAPRTRNSGSGAKLGKSMAIAGFTDFGISYVGAIIDGALINQDAMAAVPVGGPLIVAIRSNQKCSGSGASSCSGNSTERSILNVTNIVLGVVGGVAQLAGLTIGVVGLAKIAGSAKVELSEHERIDLQLLPVASSEGPGFALVATF